MTGQHREPERRQGFRDFGQLPTRPDARTGEPCPPRAPGFRTANLSAEQNPGYSRLLIRRPSPPPGMGPVLVWHRDNVLGQLLRYLVALATAVLGVAAISLLNGDGATDLLRHWQIWVIALAGSYLMSSPLTFRTVSVGADWFQTSTGRRWYQRRARTNYLRLYELTEVTGSCTGGAPELYLADGEHAMRGRLDEFQPDRRTWDLIYNGILHSVANGAKIDTVSESLLRLDEAPALGRRRLRELRAETPRVTHPGIPSAAPQHSTNPS